MAKSRDLFETLLARYPELSEDELVVLLGEASGDPMRERVLRETQRFFDLLRGAQEFDKPVLTQEALAYRASMPDSDEQPAWLSVVFHRIEHDLGDDAEARNRLHEMRRRVQEWNSESSPGSQFERLSGLSIDGGGPITAVDRVLEPGSPAIRKDANPAASISLRSRVPRRVLGSVAGIGSVYLVLFLISAMWKPAPERWLEGDRLRAMETVGLVTRGAPNSERGSAELEIGRRELAAARRSVFGLFPSRAPLNKRAAAEALERAIEIAEEESVILEEALYLRGLIYWLDGDVTAARQHLSRVASLDGVLRDRANEAIAALD